LGFVFAIAIAAGNGTGAVINALTWAKVSGKFQATDFGYWVLGFWVLVFG